MDDYRINTTEITNKTTAERDHEVLWTHLRKGTWKYTDQLESMGQDAFALYLQSKSGMSLEIQRGMLTGRDFREKKLRSVQQPFAA